MRNPDSLAAYRARLERALAYVQANLSGEVSLEGAAAAACFSKFHFHRVFTAAFGESFADCVRRLRLERAAALLEGRPSLSVTAVALESGFSSSSVLSRLFAARFGAPPSRWREERASSARAGVPRDGAPHGGALRDGLPRDGAAAMGQASPSLWETAAEGKGEGGELSIRRMEGLRFASCLHVGPYGAGVGEAWERLFRWAGPRGLLGPSARTAGVSYDNPELCPPGRCRYAACVEIPREVVPSGEASLLEFPPRNYICLRYRGEEEGLSAAYAYLFRRLLPASGFEPEDSPAIEFYAAMPGDGSFDLEIALPVRPLE